MSSVGGEGVLLFTHRAQPEIEGVPQPPGNPRFTCILCVIFIPGPAAASCPGHCGQHA